MIEQLTQQLINIVYSASIVFIVSISFSIIFQTSRFFHFAHAATIPFGAYVAYACSRAAGVPFTPCFLVGIASAAALGWSMNRFVYRPLRCRNVTPLVLLLASLGLYVILQNVIAAVFGSDTKVLMQVQSQGIFELVGARMSSIQLWTIVLATGCIGCFALMFGKSKLGLAIRAVSDDRQLSEVSGVDGEQTLSSAFLIGSVLAGLAGLLIALDVGVTPVTGLPLLLLGVVATIVGGVGRIQGIAIASVLLAICQNSAEWHYGSHWKEVVVFLILLVFLVFKPEGIIGKRINKVEI